MKNKRLYRAILYAQAEVSTCTNTHTLARKQLYKAKKLRRTKSNLETNIFQVSSHTHTLKETAIYINTGDAHTATPWGTANSLMEQDISLTQHYLPTQPLHQTLIRRKQGVRVSRAAMVSHLTHSPLSQELLGTIISVSLSSLTLRSRCRLGVTCAGLGS